MKGEWTDRLRIGLTDGKMIQWIDAKDHLGRVDGWMA